MQIFSVLRFVILGIFLIVAACTSTPDYQEPELPFGESATLRTRNFLAFGHFANVLEIDGQELSQWKWNWPDKRIALRPGDHDLLVSYTIAGGPFAANKNYSIPLPITVQVGRNYVISGGVYDKGATLRIWVEDSETKKVAGMATMLRENS